MEVEDEGRKDGEGKRFILTDEELPYENETLSPGRRWKCKRIDGVHQMDLG